MDGVRGNSGESVVYGGGVVLTLASGVEIGPVWGFFVGGFVFYCCVVLKKESERLLSTFIAVRF